MISSDSRRFVDRLCAGTAGLVAFATMVPGAATAAPAAPTIHFEHTALVAGKYGKTQSVYLTGAADFALHDVTATIDTANLANVATANFLSANEACKQTAALITCRFDSLTAKDGFASITFFDLRPAPGAKIGAEGTETLTLTSREYPAITKTAKVTIAEGVSLLAEPRVTSGKAAPGAAFSAPLAVTNAGSTPVTGVELFFYIDPWYKVAKRYDNCEYASGSAFCHFDTTLEPGRTYAPAEPFEIRLRPDTPAPSVVGPTFHWMTPVDNRNYVDLVRSQGAKPGTSGRLELVARPSARGLTDRAQSDTTVSNSQSIIIQVEGVQTSDVTAIGASVRHDVGSTVTAAVGVKNLGPAFVFGFPKAAATATVTMPRGVTVISVPTGCLQQPADSQVYLCTTTARPFDVGQKITWDFQLRIDAAGELVGTVVVETSGADPRPDNNTAKLRVNPVGSDSQSSENNNSGTALGTLPVTGTPVLLAVGFGLAFLAAGMVVFRIARRRRTRFVA